MVRFMVSFQQTPQAPIARRIPTAASVACRVQVSHTCGVRGKSPSRSNSPVVSSASFDACTLFLNHVLPSSSANFRLLDADAFLALFVPAVVLLAIVVEVEATSALVFAVKMGARLVIAVRE